MSNKPTDAEIAKLALTLLERVDLKGNEVAAFVAVNNWLQSHVDGSYVPSGMDPVKD